MANHKPKPDDRSDNVEKLQQMVHNTIENINEAEESIELGNEENRQEIEQKNERRRQSIQGMREEIKDEAAQQKNDYQ